ncbi:hypothetical protein FRC03_011408 [Tulasnella sp. 419]|nr:hypothetical protein FRC02_001770 [Tulasnella sp. 418]KAG8954769.1 hypothetical protein FRC03_011408 [Tulasnella sp. 419]
MDRNGGYAAADKTSFNFTFDPSSIPPNTMPPPGPPPPPGALGFGFDFTAGSNIFPGDRPTSPRSAGPQPDILSSTEQTHVLGFLDAFEWPFDPKLPHGMPVFSPSSHQGASHNGINQSNHSAMEVDVSADPNDSPSTHPTSSATSANADVHTSSPSSSTNNPVISLQPARSSDSSKNDELTRPAKRRKSSPEDLVSSPTAGSSHRPPRPLLTQPQKRLNHIMSEQRRRNAIKDGYATIEHLIAPDPRYTGPPPSINGGQDGKGRGRGAKGKGRGKGKMGTLFRAVEYVNFLEAGVAGLRLEVERLEAAVRDHRVQFSATSDVSHLLKFAFP